MTRGLILLGALLLSTAAMAAPAPHVQGPSACQGNCPNWHNGDIGDDPVDGGHFNINPVANAAANSAAEASSSAMAEGGNATATGGNAAANALGGAGGDGGAASLSGGINNAINFEAAASTAYAAALTASAGTCMGSSSVGGQGVGFGLSIGSTWQDDDCNRRRYSAILQSLGESEAAIQLLCLNKEVRSVLARCLPIGAIGIPVPGLR